MNELRHACLEVNSRGVSRGGAMPPAWFAILLAVAAVVPDDGAAREDLVRYFEPDRTNQIVLAQHSEARVSDFLNATTPT